MRLVTFLHTRGDDMLEKVDLKLSVSKEEYDEKIDNLRSELFLLQQDIKKLKIPVIILFEGWGASGKGSTISSVIRSLDPRGFDVYSISAVNEYEKRMPPLYRFWEKTPEYGNIAIFDRSWYFDISTNIIDTAGEFREKIESYDEINTFERQLSDDGTLIIKFFLHIDQKEQKQRFKKLLDDKTTAWRVTDKDKKHNKEYSEHFEAFDVMIGRTSNTTAPWNIIPATDKRYLRIKTLEIIIEQIKTHIKVKSDIEKSVIINNTISIQPEFYILKSNKLKEIDLTKDISDQEYEAKLKKYKDKIETLQNILYQKKIPVVIVYEGWDAAGKGGSIKRIASALDPRGYNVTTIAAPNECETGHHYLWRFWKKVPKTGHISIYDRSWYGRVLVERVEEYCKKEEWMRAYNEINEFEATLNKWGAVIIKFWLHIDKEEQLKRFNEREDTFSKKYKITGEDWRNRDKWDEYESSVDEMINYTSTDFAPWNIIEAKSKNFARIKTMEIFIDKLERILKKED